MKRIGFLVNPIAGMGGAVGLKGTDGKVEEAPPSGSTYHMQKIGHKLRLRCSQIMKIWIFLTCSGEMGEDALKEAGISVQVISLSVRR